MNQISFEKLLNAIANAKHRPLSGARLDFEIALEPKPFVAPPLCCPDDQETQLFSAEVIFVEASAAVGKSTMSKYISFRQTLPRLDLATVPVSTGSLKALVSNLSGPDDPIAAFHAGKLPVVVDALDEGLLLSGQTGFEKFLETTGEFLLQNRSMTTSPKLIIFGRRKTIEDAEALLSLSGEGISMSSVQVGFFEEREARQLINAYALAAADAEAAYRNHPEPASELVNAYFNAIEAALGLPKGQLWKDEQGRAFAGYAPVLAALGSLLAKMDNFPEVTNRLAVSEGRQEAWAVIETVLEEILKREKEKLCAKLARQLSGPVPAEAYDAHEQLTLLSRRIHGQPIGVSSRVQLPAAEQLLYAQMVEPQFRDHPFVREDKPSNPVLGALILAHAIIHDLLNEADMQLIAGLSQQPFLWRSVRTQIEKLGECLIDGKYLGYILNSYWNDPNTKNEPVTVKSSEELSVYVHLPVNEEKILRLNVMPPLHFYGQLRNCDVEVQGALKLEGNITVNTAPALYEYGKTSIFAESIEVAADNLTIEGEFWMEASAITSSPRLKLHPKKNARVGWGGAVAKSYPWSGLPSTLPSPHGIGSGDILTQLLNACASRLPGDRVLVVQEDYSFGDGEHHWVKREFPETFPRLVGLLIKHDFAKADKFSVYAKNKYRIRMNTTWTELHSAQTNPNDAPAFKAFLAEATTALKS